MLKSDVGQLEIYRYLKRMGWMPVPVVARYFRVNEQDMSDELRDMEERGLVIFGDDGNVNVPLESHGLLRRLWAKLFGY